MKIIYQYLEVNGIMQYMPMFATVVFCISFVGITIWAMRLSKNLTEEMSNLPLDKNE